MRHLLLQSNTLIRFSMYIYTVQGRRYLQVIIAYLFGFALEVIGCKNYGPTVLHRLSSWYESLYLIMALTICYKILLIQIL